MKLNKYCSYRVLALLVAAASFTACEQKDASSDPAAEEDPAAAGTASTGISKSGAVNALADAFPATLALAAFPQDAAASALVGAEATQEVDDPNAKKNLAEKVEENKSIIEGKADHCLDPNVFRPHKGFGDITCYEFDSDMNPSRFAETDGRTRPDFGTLDGTDGNGEACMVSFVRTEVQDVVETVDQALALVGGMLCQAKKDGAASSMPASGATLDLTTSLDNATGGHLTVSSAALTRLDDIGEKPVYRTDIKVTNDRGHDLEVHLVHSPGEGDNGDGTLWFIRSGGGKAQGGPAVDPNNSENKNHVMSISYSRSETDGVPNMRFESSHAAIVDTIDPVDAAGRINFADIPQDAQNSTVHAIKYVAFDGNTETNEGTLSYWMNPGGNYNESARGFLFNTAVDTTTSVLTGCGVSGATANVSIRKAVMDPSEENTLKPVRYWHPRENENIHPDKDPRFSTNEGNAITEQCFKQGTDGVYAIDTDRTKDARGYEVVTTAETKVEPPHPPEEKLEGQFVPAE